MPISSPWPKRRCWVVHQDDATLGGMDSWNQGTHAKTGLIAKVKASVLDESAAEAAALAFLAEHVPAKSSPMCGNSICQDRRFLARWMPRLEDWFHYRNLDVSTLKELCRRWKPDLVKGFRRRVGTRPSPTCASRSRNCVTTATTFFALRF